MCVKNKTLPDKISQKGEPSQKVPAQPTQHTTKVTKVKDNAVGRTAVGRARYSRTTKTIARLNLEDAAEAMANTSDTNSSEEEC